MFLEPTGRELFEKGTNTALIFTIGLLVLKA